jgi:hypothetical protein
LWRGELEEEGAVEAALFRRQRHLQIDARPALDAAMSSRSSRVFTRPRPEAVADQGPHLPRQRSSENTDGFRISPEAPCFRESSRALRERGASASTEIDVAGRARLYSVAV